VALDQSGGLRNTIYAIGHEIFILNYDHTVLLRFRLRRSEGQFETPISFKANDYDSNMFEEVDGQIVFHSEKGEYLRKKSCGTTDLTPEEVRTLYHKYVAELPERETIDLSRDVLDLLDENLSHIEFSGEEGENIKLLQRNIYSGGIIEITKKEEGLFTERLEYAFGPVGVKTDDFRALFTFQNTLKFSFPRRGREDFVSVRSGDESRRSITGVVACCLYDEIIEIREVQVQKQAEETKLKRRK